jgi:hypothetical protein
MVDFVVAESTIAGEGVFTMKNIKKDTTLFYYRGHIILEDEDPPDTTYVMEIRWEGRHYVDASNDNDNFFIDAGTDNQGRQLWEYVNVDPMNIEQPTIAKFVNHLPSNRANCRIDNAGAIIAKRRILKGEEITFAYGRRPALPGKEPGVPLDL